MIHFDDGVLRAYLDREPIPGSRADLSAHLAECPACRARVAELKRDESVVREALALLDGPIPVQAAWSRVSAGVAPRPLPRPGAGSRSGHATPWWRTPLARAAGLVLLLGGGVAAAVVPGSPLRSLWAPAHAPPASVGPAAAAAPRAGIRLPSIRDDVRVVLTAPAGTEVEIAIGGERAGIFGPPSASFSTGDGLLQADVPGGPVRIELPPTLAAGRIEINGVSTVEVRAGRLVQAPPGAAGGDGSYLARFRVR